MSTYGEELQVLTAANGMPNQEASEHYLHVAQMWYNSQLTHKLSTFHKHIPRIVRFAQEKDELLQLNSLRTLAFVSSNHKLHKVLFQYNILDLTIQFLQSSQDAQIWEAGLVVLNQVCFQTKEDFKEKKELLRKFWEKKDHLQCLFKCGNIEDGAVSIIGNTFSLLAKIVSPDRYVIQEHCARAGLIERAYNLKLTHRDDAVRSNCALFLDAMGMGGYPSEQFNEMYACVCTDMSLPSQALSLALWRLCRTGRIQDARKKSKLMNVVLRILDEDPALETESTFENDEGYPKVPKMRSSTGVYGGDIDDEENENQPVVKQQSFGNDGELVRFPSLPADDGSNNNEPNLLPRNPTIAPLNQSDELPSYHPNISKHQSVQGYDHGDEYEHLAKSKNLVHSPPQLASAASVPPTTNWEPNDEEMKVVGRDLLDPHDTDPSDYLRGMPLPLLASKSNKEMKQEEPERPVMVRGGSAPGNIHLKATNIPFSERRLDVAVLHSSPLEGESSLDLGLEREKLELVFRRTQRQMGVFFGVLTKQSLMMCIQRGAQILHISGHGPNAKMLQVEDGKGGMEDVSTNMIKGALADSSFQLKLVFVSTCYSEQVASAFMHAGVPHVVAVHSLVQIHDKMAISFAQSFYENLLGHKKTVLEAFKNAQAELRLQDQDDCCCRHEGHAAECLCPYCKKVRCCKTHHLTHCPGYIQMSCCEPKAPHEHSKKFLLLGNDEHKEKVLTDLPLAGKDELMRPILPQISTNFAHGAHDHMMKVLGRQEDVRTLVHLLHPDGFKSQDIVVLCGPKYVGCTTVGQSVAQFFTRSWYTPLFPGGVWWIDLRPLVDSDRLFGFIADRMAIDIDRGRFQYRDAKLNRMMDYPKEIHDRICMEQYEETPSIIHYVDEQDQDRYILFRAHKNQEKTLTATLDKEIYEKVRMLFKSSINEFPKEVWKDRENGTVQTRRIIFKPMDEQSVLAQIKQKCHGATLFILDHLEYKEDQLQRFLTTLNVLSNEMSRVRILLICHSNIHKEVESFDRLRNQWQIDCRAYRLKAISNTDACQLLRIRTRQLLLDYDFQGLDPPQSTEDLAKYPLFEWLAKAPKLIAMCANLIDLGVPLCVVISCVQIPSDKWISALEPYKECIEDIGDRNWYSTASTQLPALMGQIEAVKDLWSEHDDDIDKSYSNKNNSVKIDNNHGKDDANKNGS